MPILSSRELLQEQLAAVRTRAELAGATAILNELVEAHAWMQAGQLGQAESLIIEARKRLDERKGAAN